MDQIALGGNCVMSVRLSVRMYQIGFRSMVFVEFDIGHSC